MGLTQVSGGGIKDGSITNSDISADTSIDVSKINISEATESVAGLMPATDKTKLNGVESGANVNVQADWNQTDTGHDAYIKNKPTIPVDTNTTYSVAASAVTGGANIDLTDSNSATDSVKFSGSGSVTVSQVDANTIQISGTDTDTTYSDATTSVSGLMSSTDKSKLDNIAENANNYSLPAASSTVRGGIELFSNTVQEVGANTVTANAGRTYGIQVNSNGQAVVNVPWVDTDTNTTYSAGGGLTLSGTQFSHTDTSSQGSVNNSNGTVIQDVTVDGYGHVTGLASVNLDTRYLGITAKAADSDKLDGIDSGSFLRSDSSNISTAPIAWNGTLATFDPPGNGTGTDTATDVALALEKGHRIAGWTNGYIRTLLQWTSGSEVQIGASGTSLISGINLLPGSSGSAKVNGNRILTTADTFPSVVDIQEFTSSGTWTKPSGAKMVYVEVVGGGGGAGSGAKKAATSISGGGGGAGGMRQVRWIEASDCGSTETITVGAGGTGGAATTTDNTNGSPGSDGGNSSFGSHLICPGGEGGRRGNRNGLEADGGSGKWFGLSVIDSGYLYFSAGGGMSYAGSSAKEGFYSPYGPGGGGAGGGPRNDGYLYAGASGGSGFAAYFNNRWGYSSGDAINGAGGYPNYSLIDALDGLNPGDGGGGGKSGSTGSGGNGGDGGFPGGGGGGGGGTLTGTSSGTGGDGGAGVVRVYTYF